MHFITCGSAFCRAPPQIILWFPRRDDIDAFVRSGNSIWGVSWSVCSFSHSLSWLYRFPIGYVWIIAHNSHFVNRIYKIFFDFFELDGPDTLKPRICALWTDWTAVCTICEKYAEKYNIYVCIYIKNKKVGKARPVRPVRPKGQLYFNMLK